MAPIVHGLENKYGDRVKFTFLDIDDPATEPIQRQLEYNYNWRPYILLVDAAGAIRQVFIGVIAPDELELAVLDLLGE